MRVRASGASKLARQVHNPLKGLWLTTHKTSKGFRFCGKGYGRIFDDSPGPGSTGHFAFAKLVDNYRGPGSFIYHPAPFVGRVAAWLVGISL